VRFARRAARLTQNQNADVLVSLAEAYADAGRYGEADAAFEDAIALVERAGGDWAGQIRARREATRARAKDQGR
jgi:spermidine synthase